MAKNEKTSRKVASLASKGLKGKSLSTRQKKSVFVSALTQAPNRAKKGRS